MAAQLETPAKTLKLKGEFYISGVGYTSKGNIWEFHQKCGKYRWEAVEVNGDKVSSRLGYVYGS